MNAITLISRRELSAYLNTVWGYAIMGFVLLLNGLLFNAFALTEAPRYSAEILEDFFYFSSGTTMIAGILLSMKVLAEERTRGTVVLLQTAPIKDHHIVIGKFFGAFSFLSLITLLSIYMPILIQLNGKVAWSQIGTGYMGLLLLGASTISIGTFASAISRSQLVAAIFGAGVLVLGLLGWLLGKITTTPLNEFFSYIALFDRHFQPFLRGRINTESIFYFVSLSFFFLLLSIRVLQSRRQS
jgi:ABC-2 type transport system permease protein